MVETHLTREQRWNKARELQTFYNKHYNTNVSVSAFYKDENPLTEKLVKYEITFGFNHKGNSKKLGGSYEFYIPQETFTIYALDDAEADEIIKENVAGAVSQKFRGGATTWVYDELIHGGGGDNIKIVRGIEKGDIDYKDIDTDKIAIDKNSYSQNVSVNFEVGSVRKSKDNKIPYDVSIYI